MYEYKAHVRSVFDGDTIRIDQDMGCKIFRNNVSCRLFGINAPEMRGSERPLGIISRDTLREKILGKDVIIHTKKDKSGKYGRLLVEIYFDGENVNHWLVEQGLAVSASY